MKLRTDMTIATILFIISMGISMWLFYHNDPNIKRHTPHHPQRDTITVKITTYDLNSCLRYGHHYITSSRDTVIPRHIYSNRWCAVSRDLMDSLGVKFDDTIFVVDAPYDGRYIVKDVTAKRIRNTVDILIPRGQQHTMYHSKVILP